MARGDEPARELVTTAEWNAADALHRCNRALVLDGKRHGYPADEWLATVYDIASPLLRSARTDEEPPTAVRQAQEAISWLARGVLELDEDSPEAPSTLSEALARLLSLWIFANAARGRGRSRRPVAAVDLRPGSQVPVDSSRCSSPRAATAKPDPQ
jgi:hypothetical protein